MGLYNVYSTEWHLSWPRVLHAHYARVTWLARASRVQRAPLQRTSRTSACCILQFILSTGSRARRGIKWREWETKRTAASLYHWAICIISSNPGFSSLNRETSGDVNALVTFFSPRERETRACERVARSDTTRFAAYKDKSSLKRLDSKNGHARILYLEEVARQCPRARRASARRGRSKKNGEKE